MKRDAQKELSNFNDDDLSLAVTLWFKDFGIDLQCSYATCKVASRRSKEIYNVSYDPLMIPARGIPPVQLEINTHRSI